MASVWSSALTALLLLTGCCARGSLHNTFTVTDEQYHSMPQLFHLDEYESCLATRGAYCLGSFDLAADKHSPLLQLMQEYSTNHLDNYNHTLLHRGLCLTRSCTDAAPSSSDFSDSTLAAWFASCVNASVSRSHGLTARLLVLEYCRAGGAPSSSLTYNQYGFAAFVALLLAITILSTVIDVFYSTKEKAGKLWAVGVSWSLRSSWRSLTGPPAADSELDLTVVDALRVLATVVVMGEHTIWVTFLTHIENPRFLEQTHRHSADGLLLSSGTLVVQIFFVLSSFLLARKVLQRRDRGERLPLARTFISLIFNRIARVGPAAWTMLWFAASWWQRTSDGPLWAPLVAAEADICRRKWWTHLLFLNNILYADDKCLTQTWYLAADLQLYALAAATSLATLHMRSGRAVRTLAAMLLASVALNYAVARHWQLMPNSHLHNPEQMRLSYHGSSTFNLMYQSPLGNVSGALAGLLLARLLRLPTLAQNQWTRVACRLAAPGLLGWMLACTLLGMAAGASAGVTALERPGIAMLTALCLLGAMLRLTGWQRVAESGWWRAAARLSYCALLLNVPLNKSLGAARLLFTAGRLPMISEWFGMTLLSYILAIPLALLVELPAQRLHAALCSRAPEPVATATRPPTVTSDATSRASDHTESTSEPNVRHRNLIRKEA